ncbi:MAG TPA: hypothetical protein VLF91_01785 [Candidatus Saccharimonadales bacterium]|nr:hypothetical protein [Candidatus Saccharimonadales bacterium]
MPRTRQIIITLLTLLCVGGAPLLASGVASAAYNPFQQACNTASHSGSPASSSPACTTTGTNPLTGKDGILYRTSRILGLVAGIGAVFMVLVGSIRYITAGGDANKAREARSVITGALIGLLLIALAEAMISLVVNIVR